MPLAFLPFYSWNFLELRMGNFCTIVKDALHSSLHLRNVLICREKEQDAFYIESLEKDVFSN